MLSLSLLKDDHWCLNIFLSLCEVFPGHQIPWEVLFSLTLDLTKFPLGNNHQILLQGLKFSNLFLKLLSLSAPSQIPFHRHQTYSPSHSLYHETTLFYFPRSARAETAHFSPQYPITCLSFLPPRSLDEETSSLLCWKSYKPSIQALSLPHGSRGVEENSHK